jgi:hypothetical protein
MQIHANRFYFAVPISTISYETAIERQIRVLAIASSSQRPEIETKISSCFPLRYGEKHHRDAE